LSFLLSDLVIIIIKIGITVLFEQLIIHDDQQDLDPIDMHAEEPKQHEGQEGHTRLQVNGLVIVNSIVHEVIKG